ncbi:MAG TPA: serine/threonine-protein kinase [Candidatus Obscuribacterales bacterium]
MAEQAPTDERHDSSESGSEATPSASSGPSKLLGDRYQVLATLGQGGMGTVLKGRHATLGKLVAIKVLNAGLLLDQTNRLRFEQEAQAGSALSHPNLVAVFDHGFTPAGEPFLVMEYVEGESLDVLLSKRGPLRGEEFLDIFRQVCKALQYIHKKNIIHRDIKTSNIMIQVIDDERYVKLLDFGIAKVLPESGYTGQHLTATGTVFGSPLYMSPEQCMGSKTDARSDIYSLGCVMYECLCGEPPLRGENALQTFYKHINDSPRPLTSCDSFTEFDRKIASIVEKCLAKSPEKRFESAGDLLAAFGQLRGIDAPENRISGQNIAPNAPSARPSPIAGGAGAPNNFAVSDQSEQADGGAQQSPAKQESTTGLAGSLRKTDPELERRKQSTSAQQSTAGNTFVGSHAAPEGKNVAHDHEQSRKLRRDIGNNQSALRPLRIAIPALIGVVAIGLVTAAALVIQPSISQFSRVSSAITAKPAAAPTERGSFKEAEQYFKLGPAHWHSAEPLYMTLVDGDDETSGRAKARLGRINLRRKDYNAAFDNFSSAIANLSSHHETSGEYYLDALFGLGQTFADEGNFKQAEIKLKEAQALAREQKNPGKEAEILTTLARNASENDTAEAIRFYHQALAVYSKLDVKPNEQIADVLLNMANLYKMRNMKARAAMALRQARQKAALVTIDALREELELRARALDENETAPIAKQARPSAAARPAARLARLNAGRRKPFNKPAKQGSDRAETASSSEGGGNLVDSFRFGVLSRIQSMTSHGHH